MQLAGNDITKKEIREKIILGAIDYRNPEEAIKVFQIFEMINKFLLKGINFPGHLETSYGESQSEKTNENRDKHQTYQRDMCSQNS